MSYVAKKALYIGFTKARNAGDVVTDEELTRFPEWRENVEKETAKTKAADNK